MLHDDTTDEIDIAITAEPGNPKSKNAHLWDRHPEDYYIEPDWCSERLFAQERFEGSITDPSCGSGRILRSAKAAGYEVDGSDLVRRSEWCDVEEDFLQSRYACDNIVSNPPFGLCNKADKTTLHTTDFAWVIQALKTAEKRIALLLPISWMTGGAKATFLQTTPLEKVLIVSPRPSMPPGPVIEAGLVPGGGKADFAWFIWTHGYTQPATLGWLNRDAT